MKKELPKKTSKRANQRPILAWVDKADMEILKDHQINVNELIRQYVWEIATQLREKK